MVLTGVASSGCVDCTARDGFMLNYYIVFVGDCTATYDRQDHLTTCATINKIFGVVCNAQEFSAIWGRVPTPVTTT